MKDFKNFLSEMPTLRPNYSKSRHVIDAGKSRPTKILRKNKLDYDPEVTATDVRDARRIKKILPNGNDTPHEYRKKARQRELSYKKVSVTSTGHYIMMSRNPNTQTHFKAYNPKTKQIDMQVRGIKHNGKFQVDVLSGREGSTLKAHEFYHHLLDKGHVKELHSSDSHSRGGFNTWGKLSQHPGVDMHMIDGSGNPMQKSDNWEKNYSLDGNGPHLFSHFVAKKKLSEDFMVEMPTLVDYGKVKNQLSSQKKIYRPRKPNYYPKPSGSLPKIKQSKDDRIEKLQYRRAHDTQNSYKKVSVTSTGHHILASKKKEGSDGRVFKAYNPKTKQIDMQVNGWHNSGGRFRVDHLSGREGSTLKAHEFYHHLLDKGHVKELHSSDTQSKGGSHVWKKLSQHPGVDMKAASRDLPDLPSKEFHLHRGDDWMKNYATKDDPSKSPKHNITFVATKKKLSEQILDEMPRLINDYSKESNRLDSDHYSNKEDHGNHVSTTNTGHRIYFKSTPGGTGSQIKAVDKKTGKVDVHIVGNHHKPSNTFQIGMVKAAEGSKLKAADLYSHLATKWKMNIASSSGQSVGGMKIWKHLSKNPKLEMMKINNMEDKKKIPIKANWRHNYTVDRNKPEAKSIFVMRAKKK